ncbi:hypothetical protein LENED_009177 [Lentinula edodes]|uniref:Uncharacterized protein n=1 Tax=Lentinula edodes TaxID=5353 RepID=A0A1Q3EJ28_LENED|nr:hypothetical protein LENED_009177 [Lentinula edodes]
MLSDSDASVWITVGKIPRVVGHGISAASFQIAPVPPTPFRQELRLNFELWANGLSSRPPCRRLRLLISLRRPHGTNHPGLVG